MRTFLMILIAFAGTTAVTGGLLMIAYPDGTALGLTKDLLEGTSLKNFFIPGVILTIIGMVNTGAFLTHYQKHNNQYNWSVAGGALFCSWIVTQVIIIQLVSWLYFFYFLCGLLIVLMSYQLKEKQAA